MISGFQSRIVGTETAQGQAFAAPAAMSVLQPGTVEERTDEQPADPPADQPAEGQSNDLITQALTYEAQGLLAVAERAYAESRWSEAQGKYARLQETRYSQYL